MGIMFTGGTKNGHALGKAIELIILGEAPGKGI
jgi:hypothetical protein